MSRKHTCHAIGCERACKPEYLMCRAHWFMVPRPLQLDVYRHYRPGQCQDLKFSREWHYAAYAAINAVALAEGHITQTEADARIARLAKLYEEQS